MKKITTASLLVLLGACQAQDTGLPELSRAEMASLPTSADFEPMPLSAAQVATVQAAIRNKLVDPDSAQFRSLQAERRKDRSDNTYTVCGEVNARNRMGGYNGFQPFSVLVTGDVVHPDATVIGGFAGSLCQGRL